MARFQFLWSWLGQFYSGRGRKSGTPRHQGGRGRLNYCPQLEKLEDRLNPSTLLVGPGNHFTTISQAAAVAVAGDTVQVAAGTYNEAVLVQKTGTAAAP